MQYVSKQQQKHYANMTIFNTTQVSWTLDNGDRIYQVRSHIFEVQI